MSRLRPTKGRRVLRNLRRHARDGGTLDPAQESTALVPTTPSYAPVPHGVGWDHSAAPTALAVHEQAAPQSGLDTRALALLADPRVDFLTVESTARALGVPMQDAETALESMRQAGALLASAGAVTCYSVTPETKAELEAEFRASAHELGEHNLLARLDNEETALAPFEEEEPRLPATAGLLSLFLPGTGQLLNGDVGRASLVFAVWSLAWITHLSPVWTFVCLYAGAEAFFTAKIRSMERKLQEERMAAGPGPDPKKLPSPRMT